MTSFDVRLAQARIYARQVRVRRAMGRQWILAQPQKTYTSRIAV
jgi:hypothetical protein